MTPKEKAKELYDKFYFVNSESVELITGEYEMLFSLHESDAKQCALIALDEIIEALELNSWQNINQIKYYQEIKQEIEKL
jgi:hypothetical protein